jgi:hypothetical protein
MTKILLGLFICSFSFAFDGSRYAQSGEELCNFINHFYGGLNPYSMQCSMGAGSGEYTPHESGFCQKVISEKRMRTSTCLDVISKDNSDARLDACEPLKSEKEILNCLQQGS